MENNSVPAVPNHRGDPQPVDIQVHVAKYIDRTDHPLARHQAALDALRHLFHQWPSVQLESVRIRVEGDTTRRRIHVTGNLTK